MPSTPLPGHFYLGRLAGAPDRYLYDPADLTTHAVVVGMTGSGKTGLCLALLEEAALHGYPALLIDPKGDIANLLLQFPDLAPADFLPWIDPDAARRAGQTVEEAAARNAARWRDGLAQWDLGPEDLRALRAAADFTLYTPGSQAGRPISILASLRAPDLPWEENQETLRERIAATVTALLGLVGIPEADPLASREHILLANLFERAWAAGRDLDLAELILQTQNPPFARLGVFDLEQFFPQRERFGLAMRLNNILAAPAFQSWVGGDPLDVQSLLYTPQGRPRHAVIYIAHLTDAERMFIVTLLLSALETWMRAQPGASGLRALCYMDELFGYLPPVSAPPSKNVLLRLLKTGRAFGLGLLLATQNPVDLDYKALSNAGSWFVGKLQTEQDRDRLLDGLADRLDRAAASRLISTLDKRVFLAHNVHSPTPVTFHTRWAMCYLAGPLARTQLRTLATPAPSPASPAAEAAPSPLPSPAVGAPAAAASSRTRPVVPAPLAEYFLPHTRTLAQAAQAAGRAEPIPQARLLYQPGLLAQARVRFFDRKTGVDEERRLAAFVPDPQRRGILRWEAFPFEALDPASLPAGPQAGAAFADLDPLLAAPSAGKAAAALQREFVEHLYRSATITLLSNPALKLTAPPGASTASFRQQCADAARQARDAEAAKEAARYDAKLKTLRDKLTAEERDLEEYEEELSARQREQTLTDMENVLGLFGGRRRSLRRGFSTSASKRRLTEKARAGVGESRELIAQHRQDIAALEAEKEQALAAITDRWAAAVEEVREVRLTPLKKDIAVELFGVAWQPTWAAELNGETIALPA